MGGGEREREKGERHTPFIKSLLCASVLPGTEFDVWPTMLSREQRCYQKSDPAGDHYDTGCLRQTQQVSLPQ